MEYNDTEKEINLKDMFFSAFRKWRGTLITGAVVLVLFSLYRIPAFINIGKNAETAAEAAVDILEYLAKTFVIGFVLGVLGAGFFNCVAYVMNGKVKSASDFYENMGSMMIAAIPSKDDKRSGAIDNMVKEAFGVKLKVSDKEGQINRLVEELKILIGRKAGRKLRVVCASSCSKRETDEVIRYIQKGISEVADIVNGGSVLMDAGCVKAIDEGDYVLLCERQGVSDYTDLRKTMQKLKRWDKKVLGAVMLDADARKDEKKLQKQES